MKIIKPSIEVIDWGFWDEYDRRDIGFEILSKIERIGRVCYKSEEKITDNSYITFIQNLLKRGHEAVLEHHSISVRIICDRGVSHELVRHRVASYCQESTRYCNYGKSEIKTIPMLTNLTEEQIKRREKLYNHCEEVYNKEINEGITPQQARDNLPTCLKTEIVITANLREWLHILELRCSKKAHPQMREVMNMVLKEFQTTIPIIFDNIGEKDGNEK